MKRYFKLYLDFFKNCLSREMEFRYHFILQNIASLIWALVILLVFIFIYNHIDSVNGWTLESMLLLSAIYFLTDRIFDSFFELNFWNLSFIVNTGKLDYILTKPISSQFYISLRRFSFAPVFSNISMALLIIYLTQKFFMPTSWLQIATFLILLFCSIIITYSLWFITLMPIFWWGRVDNIHHLFRPVHQLARIPIDVTGRFKPFLTYVFPLAFVATIPAKALIGNLSFHLPVYGIIISLSLLIISNKLWHFALKHYTSASS